MKPRYDLIPAKALKRLAERMSIGSKKYEPEGWRHLSRDELVDKVLRHFYQWRLGEKSEDHLGAAACNIMFLLDND